MDDSNVSETGKNNLIKNAQSIQQTEIIYSNVSKDCLTENEKEAIIEFARPCDTSTRYTITIVDTEIAADIDKMKFIAFVVPLGKENEWMFSTSEGRQVLRQHCGVERVAMISMHEGHEYPDLRGIRTELKETIIKLAPQGVFARGENVPFLTLPENSGTNTSSVRARGESKFSGKFVVEDVVEKDEHFRRLVFLNRGHIIQSEVKLKTMDGAKKEKEEVDVNYVSCEYYILLNVGVSLAISQFEKAKYEVLLLGLGGGVLTTLMHRCFKEVFITAIEIDEAIAEIAKEHFHLKPDERMKVNIADGLEYLTEAGEKEIKYDVIIFDVDNKDPRIGISCPPVSFLQIDVLNEVVRSLTDKGLFLINLVCRSRKLRQEIFQKLRSIFAGVISLKTKEDVNEMVICWKESLHINQEHIENATKMFYDCSKEQNITLDEDVFNISTTMERVKV